MFSHLLKKLFALTSLTCIAFGSESLPYSAELLDEGDGFESSIIFSISQDHRGFLWFGTAYDGVLRYDGKNVVQYSVDSALGYQLPDNNAGNLTFDNDNNLWVGGWGSGAVKLDPITGEYEQFLPSEANNGSISSSYIQNIFVDSENQIWLGSNGNGLNLFNSEENNFKHFNDTNEFTETRPGKVPRRIWDIEQLTSDALWLGTGSGLSRLDIKDARLTHFRADKTLRPNGVNKVRKVISTNDNKLVLGTHDGVLLFDPSTQVFMPIVTEQQKTLGPIFSLLNTSFGQYWVSTGSGVYFFTDDNLQLQKVPLGVDDSCSQTLFEDKQQIIWISCEGKGVYKVLRNTIFKSLSTPLTRSIYSLALGQNGRIVLGTEANGIHALEKKTGQFTQLSRPLQNAPFPSANRVAQLANGDILYSNYESLFVLNKNGHSHRVVPPIGTQAADKFKGFVHLQQMANGEIWIGGSSGVFIIDKLTQPFRYLSNKKHVANSLSSNAVHEIFEDKYDRIWVGTRNGLNLWRPKTQSFTRFFVNDKDGEEFSNFINTIAQDNQNRIWVSTRLGLYEVDFANNTLISQQIDEFSENYGIHFIFADAQENLWLFSHTGIVKYAPNKGTFTSFDRSDGLSKSRFFVNLATQDEQGTIYYSSRDGIHFFNPNEVGLRDTNIPTHLTHFEVLGASSYPVSILNPKSEIQLSPDENYIKLEFSTLDLINARQLKYQYKLDGLDDSWIDNGTNNSAVYTNLSGGDYVFRVRPYLKRERFYTPELAMSIKIATPIWQRGWMFFVYVLILILCINIYIRYRQRQSELEVEQQKQFVTELEKQVNEKTETILEESKKLATANKVKSEFLANMSHEIRTPLTSVIGHSESIIYGDVEQIDVLDEVSKIHSHGRYLMSLLNDILDVTKIEQNKIELEPSQLDLHRLLDEILDMYTYQAQKKGLSFSIVRQIPENLCGVIDGLRLKQVLLNLCSNAIKFTPVGKVTLIVSYPQQRLLFNIIDTGIGMTVEQMDKIFGVFTQGDSSINRRFGGSGLGLSLSHKLVELMGGELSVSSDVNKGSMFTFSLEFNQCYPKRQSDISVSHSNLPKFQGSILIADDHNDNRNLIIRLLKRLGLTVYAAENGFEAIVRCEQNQPDLIMLDIQMPEKDGIQTIREMRSMGFTQPTIALTANVMESDVELYESVGFDGYLSKPLDRSKLVDILSQFVTSLTSAEDALLCLESSNNDDLTLQFLASLEDEVVQFQMLLQSNDYQGLRQQAHRLAGAAHLFNCKPLADAAIALERAMKNAEYAVADSGVKGLFKQIEICLADGVN